MKHILFCFVAILVLRNVMLSPVDEVIKNYFESQTLEDFHTIWQKVRRSYEQAVAIGLKEAFGTETQNVFVPQESPQLSGAYYLSDNIVDLLLLNLTMKYQIPRLRPFPPEVNLALSDNLIRVHAELDQIFVDADYYLFRNKSDILLDALENPYKSSPFTLQEVQRQGKLTIVADNCRLVGIATTIIRGLSVSMGYSHFQVTRCQFRIEIHKSGFGSPPVMVPYFSIDQGRSFEILLSKPIASEINPKLQGILFSVINTTSIFDLKIGAVRNAQRNLNRKVSEYMRKIVTTMNDITSTTNGGVSSLIDLKLIWDDVTGVDYPSSSSIILNSMTLNGLETAYCAQVGGPYRAPSIKIADEIRFQELQVRGKKYIENSTHKEMQEVTVELLDVAVSIKMYMDDATKKDGGEKDEKGVGGEGEEGEGGEEGEEGEEGGEDEEYEGGNRKSASKLRAKSNYYLEFIGWRKMEYYAITGPKNPLHYLIVGYVVDEIPHVILDHLYHVLDQAIAKVDSSVDDQASAQEEGPSPDAALRQDRGHIDDYDSEEFPACKGNQKNCKKKKKALRKKNKNRARVHRRQHRHAIDLSAESSDNNPSDVGDSVQVRNVLGDRGQGDIVGHGSTERDIGDGDNIDNGGDTLTNGNVNTQNGEDDGSSFNDGNENNGPAIYSDDNVNSYSPSGGNVIYSDGNVNYDSNSIFPEGNVGHGNSKKGDDNNNRKSNNILPSEAIKSQNQTLPNTNV